LPDGRHYLYLALSGQQANNAIYVMSLDSPETRRLLSGAEAGATYAPPGYLLFLRGTTLMAQPFDAERLELTGEPHPIAENVIFNIVPRLAGFSVSDNGVLVYRSNASANTQLTWFDRAGRPLGTVGPTADQRNHALSPDGRRVAVGRIDLDAGTRDIWLIDLERGTNTRFTSDPSNDAFPLWSPDGSRIVFSSQRETGLAAIYQKPASGTGSEELFVQANLPVIPTDWSRDGQYLLCQTSNDPKTHFDLWVLPLSGERKLIPLFQTEFNEVQGQFSPDARWVAYASNESGRLEIYVQSFPPGRGKWQISTNGGAQPQWRRDGRELFYMSGDLKLMAVEIRAAPNRFEASLPRPLFNLHIVTLPVVRNHYAVSADGQRFLVNTLVEESAPSPLTVVMNWTADLKK
jgi:dipeptidyl aminopeptidase/acylaminoacyl peptidase